METTETTVSERLKTLEKQVNEARKLIGSQKWWCSLLQSSIDVHGPINKGTKSSVAKRLKGHALSMLPHCDGTRRYRTVTAHEYSKMRVAEEIVRMTASSIANPHDDSLAHRLKRAMDLWKELEAREDPVEALGPATTSTL